MPHDGTKDTGAWLQASRLGRFRCSWDVCAMPLVPMVGRLPCKLQTCGGSDRGQGLLDHLEEDQSPAVHFLVEWMQTEPVPHAFIFNVPTCGSPAAANTLKKHSVARCSLAHTPFSNFSSKAGQQLFTLLRDSAIYSVHN